MDEQAEVFGIQTLDLVIKSKIFYHCAAWAPPSPDQKSSKLINFYKNVK
jgi:hypothetical protein